jgi:DNA-directed RNA polymerase specialized sigma24 family protein
MFQKYSNYLQNYDARQDAFSLMRIKIWQAITDISDSREAQRYEYIFWVTVKWRISTIVKQARKQEEERLASLTLDTPKLRDDGETGETWGDGLEDEEETARVSQLLDKMAWQLFLEEIPSPKHKTVFLARSRGDTWEAAAKKAGVTAKTASKYGNEMYEILTRVLKADIAVRKATVQK